MDAPTTSGLLKDGAGVLLDWLTGQYPDSSRQSLKTMVEGGRVRIDGRVARRIKEPLPAGATVTVAGKRQMPRVVPALPDGVRIIFEDADLFVVHKPPGLLTSTVPGEKRQTLIAVLREYVSQREPAARVGVIHRLDRDARGLLVFSKNHDAFRELKRQFFEHTVQRIYTAVVDGVPAPRATIDTHLLERADGQMYSTTQPGKGQRAVTEYEMIRNNGKRALLRVTLRTGRKHQIRAHLSQRNTPVVGDSVYGNSAPIEPGTPPGLMLAATHLAFAHPRDQRSMVFSEPVPPDMELLVP